MISFNTQFPAIRGPMSPMPGRKAAEAGPSSESVPQQDGVSLTRSQIPGDAPSAVAAIPPDKLGETGFATALQALPPGGHAAQMLTSEPAPMTQQQQSACIADLETLNLTGQLKRLDPETFEISKCNVAQALDSMANGQGIYYSQGKNGPMGEIADLEQLSAAARQAQLGIVG
jgi:hypothetical protein